MANSIRIDADAAAAVAELDKLSAANDKIGDSVDEVIQTTRSAAAEERRLANLREKVLRESSTAQQRLEKRVEDVNKALKGTQVSEEQLGRIRERVLKEHQVNLDRERDELEKTQEQLEEVEEASGGAFDPRKIASFATGILSAAGAATNLLDVLADINREAEEAANAVAGTVDSSGALVQLAGGDQARRDQLLKFSDAIFASGFVGSRDAANQLTFELESGGKLTEAEFFARLNTIDDAASIARSARLVESGFAGSGEDVGGSPELVSKALETASEVTGVNASEVLEAVAQLAPTAKPLGLTDEELFAALGQAAERTGSASEAATQLRQLFSQLSRQGVADEAGGRGLNEIVRVANQLAGETEQERTRFLGGTEAVGGLDALLDSRRLSSRQREITQAAAQRLADQTIANALSAERIQAVVARQAAEARDTIAIDDTAIDRLLSEAAEAEFRTRDREVFGDTIASIRSRGRQAVDFLDGGSTREVIADRQRDVIADQGFGSDLKQVVQELKLSREVAEKQAAIQERTRKAVGEIDVGIPSI